jgi:Protein of unknown function (DUF1501)
MLSRRTFLAASAAFAAASTLDGPLGGLARAKSLGAAKNLIVVLAYGGWDVTYALDPKPGDPNVDVPAGTIKTYGSSLPIYVDPSRQAVTDFFDAYGSSVALINGVHVQSIVHTDCSRRILTGTASDLNPDLGAICAYELGRDLPAPYLVLGPTAYTGALASISARAGTTNQIVDLISNNGFYEKPFVPDSVEAGYMRTFVEARANRELSTRGLRGYNNARMQDFVDSLTRGDKLKNYASGFGQRSFTVGMANQVPLAVNALQTGLCRAIHLEDNSGWDTHTMNTNQAARHNAFYTALKQLADLLAKTPGKATGSKLLDETVVAVFSEMSRTPKLNAQQGKDHWPVTSSLVFGGGIAGGRLYGGSSDKLEALTVNYQTGAPDPNGQNVQFSNLVAGVLSSVGVDPTKYLANVEPFDAFSA